MLNRIVHIFQAAIEDLQEESNLINNGLILYFRFLQIFDSTSCKTFKEIGHLKEKHEKRKNN